jgi:uncharacterized protein (DUF2147 family)
LNGGPKHAAAARVKGRTCLATAVFLISLLFFSTPIFASEPGDAILGVWHTTDDKSQVQVFKENGHYFGKILSLKEPNWPADDDQGMSGKPKNDRKNPDPKLRSRPIAGITIMMNFDYSGNNTWESGRVYDPESGSTYRGKMSLTATNRLELRGYVGIPLFGRTEVWTRQAP